jgi:hypothetical protein
MRAGAGGGKPRSPTSTVPLIRAWSYWRSRASCEHGAVRIDAVFEQQLAEGPDFARYHRDGPRCASTAMIWPS